jgi:hypothetical protein
MTNVSALGNNLPHKKEKKKKINKDSVTIYHIKNLPHNHYAHIYTPKKWCIDKRSAIHVAASSIVCRMPQTDNEDHDKINCVRNSMFCNENKSI